MISVILLVVWKALAPMVSRFSDSWAFVICVQNLKALLPIVLMVLGMVTEVMPFHTNTPSPIEVTV